MTGAIVFLKKEFREILRTHKIYVVPCIFLFFAISSPLLAKLTPELVKSLVPNFEVTLPEPKAADSYLQLFKNLNQIGILAVIFTSIGLVADEKVRGTAILMLTKPVPKWSFIISKFIATSALVLGALLLAYGVCLYYTLFLFKDAMFAISAQAIILAIAYYLLIIAVTLLASTISRSLALSGAFSVGAFLLLSILPALHKSLAQYTPGALPNFQDKLLAGTATFGEAVPALMITLAAVVVLLVLTVLIFKRQEL
jgi:ABC-2 type transport system permease protein